MYLYETWRRGLTALAIAAVVIAGLVATIARVGAADHADAPGVQGDPQADITDIYAFRSPTNSDNLVAVLNVNPLTAPTQNGVTRFGDDVVYQLFVDNTGDLLSDAVVTVTFSNNGKSFTIDGLGDPIVGVTSGPGPALVVEAGGIRPSRACATTRSSSTWSGSTTSSQGHSCPPTDCARLTRRRPTRSRGPTFPRS